MKKAILIGLLSCSSASALGQSTAACAPAETLQMEILGRTERSQRAFTQGFEIFQGMFLESTGAYKAHTQLNQIQKDGSQTTVAAGPQGRTFGEGLTVHGGKVYQATWQDRKMFVFTPQGVLEKILELPFDGWGLTNDGTHLILTDGSPTLRFLNPEDLSVTRDLQIRIEKRPLSQVNELEWIDGKIFGNVFQKSSIVRIDPASGCVDGLLDASSLYAQLPEAELQYLRSDRNHVLNGIAFDAETGEIHLTGKNWKYIFTVKLK